MFPFLSGSFGVRSTACVGGELLDEGGADESPFSLSFTLILDASLATDSVFGLSLSADEVEVGEEGACAAGVSLIFRSARDGGEVVIVDVDFSVEFRRFKDRRMMNQS